MPKTFGDTSLFRMYPEYNKKLTEFIFTAEQINPNGDEFADIMFDIKRQNVGVSITRVAESSNVKLMYSEQPLPSQFRVFAAKDLKGKDTKLTKIYMDCSTALTKKDGVFSCRNIDVLIAYLVSAMTAVIYQADDKRITSDTSLVTSATAAYSILMTHVIDYVFKISINPELKAKCKYLSARFFLQYVLSKDSTASMQAIARKVSGVGDREERMIEISCNEKSFDSLDNFIETINHVLKINLNLSILVDKWMFVFGPSTVFGIEYFPSFSSMLTDAYVGCYINNQKTIEKIVGKEMVDYTKELFLVGDKAISGR
jgi:hypothetical protein